MRIQSEPNIFRTQEERMLSKSNVKLDGLPSETARNEKASERK